MIDFTPVRKFLRNPVRDMPPLNTDGFYCFDTFGHLVHGHTEVDTLPSPDGRDHCQVKRSEGRKSDEQSILKCTSIRELVIPRIGNIESCHY